ncbi:MAG: hypothetical protein R3A79_23255 [Nannocystaceae bacterium]
MLAPVLALALALTAGAAATQAAAEPGSTAAEGSVAAPTRILGAVTSIEGVDAAATREALALRLPDLPLYDRREGAPSSDADGLFAYLEIRRRDPATVDLRIILSDGRAFRRAVAVDSAEPPRVIAGTLASLLPAIAEASVEADEEDVPLPEALRPVELPLEPLPAPEPEPETAPEPEPGPEPEPESQSQSELEPADPRDAPPLFELGLGLASGALVGAGPGSAWRGPSGSFDALLRWRAGFALGLDLRLAGGAALDLRALRLRSAVTFGYVLRRGAFELPLLGLLGVEPWWARNADGPVALANADDSGPPRPLLAAALRLAPGFRLAVGRDLHLRIGARVEAALSGEPRQGLRQPQLRDPAVDGPVLTLGGPELSAGLDLTLWLPARPAGERRPPAKRGATGR